MDKEDLKKKLCEEAGIRYEKTTFLGKISQFMGYLSIFLLLAFVGSMVVVSLVYIFNVESFVVYEDSLTGELSGDSVGFYERSKGYGMVIFFGLLGWLLVSPDFRRGIRRVYGKFDEWLEEKE